MNKACAALIMAVCFLGASAPGFAGRYTGTAQYVGQPAANVTRLFAQFSGGGRGLAEAVAAMLISNPALADDVAFVAASGNALQQAAAASGMAAAAAALASAGNSSDAGNVGRAAQASGNAIIAAAADSRAIASGGTGAGLFVSPGNPSVSNPQANSPRRCTTVAANTVSPASTTTICQ